MKAPPTLLVIGLSHRSAPLILREKLSFSEAILTKFAAGNNDWAAETVTLSTCNRLELYALSSRTDWLEQSYARFCQALGLPNNQVVSLLYHYTGQAAVNHLLQVSTSLDSLVLGENEILSQVRAAIIQAVADQTAGPILRRLFDRAIRAGKRARAETAISRHTTSSSHLAIQLIRRHLATTPGKLLVIGAGKAGRLAVQASLKGDFATVTVINRTTTRAQSLADEFGVHAKPWAALAGELSAADAVVSAIRLNGSSLPAESINQTWPAGSRPKVLVDLSVPRSLVPPEWVKQENHLYNVDDLAKVVQAGTAKRLAEVPLVRQIIGQESLAFWTWWQQRINRLAADVKNK